VWRGSRHGATARELLGQAVPFQELAAKTHTDAAPTISQGQKIRNRQFPRGRTGKKHLEGPVHPRSGVLHAGAFELTSPGGTMRTRIRIAAAGITATALFTLTACTGTTDPKGPIKTGAPDAPIVIEPSDGPPAGTAPKTARLPDLVGKVLQTAQDEAQAAGFFTLTSSDALGQSRLQVLDRNWKVCTQNPQPGSHRTDVKVDFRAVKIEEDCP
jgi:hypothetical protein